LSEIKIRQRDHGGLSAESGCFASARHSLRIGQWDTGRRREVFPCPFAILVAEERRQHWKGACARHPKGTCCPATSMRQVALRVHSSGCPRSLRQSIPEGDENQNTICPTCSTGDVSYARSISTWKPEAFRHISVGNATVFAFRDAGISTRVNTALPPNRTKCKHGQGNNEVQVQGDGGRGREGEVEVEPTKPGRGRSGRQTNNNNTAGNAR
jgi:hypothetical protein